MPKINDIPYRNCVNFVKNLYLSSGNIINFSLSLALKLKDTIFYVITLRVNYLSYKFIAGVVNYKVGENKQNSEEKKWNINLEGSIEIKM